MLFCVVIISAFFTVCKKLIPLGLHDCAADLPQPHLRDVAGGDAQGVDGGGRVEFVHMGELIGRKILVCRQAEAGHQHICHTDLQRVPVENLKVQIVQLLQQAVLPALPQVLQVIRDVVRYGVVAGGAHRVRQIFFFGQVAEGSFQCFNDSRFKVGLHCPDGQRTGKPGFVRIRHIEVELQQMLSIVTEHGNAFRTAIDPAAKLTVPSLHLKDCGGVRALGIDQDLLIKRTFVVIAGRTEKACPAFIAAGDASHGLVIQLGDELKFGRQGNTSYRSGSARFLARERALFFSCARYFSKAAR